MASTSRRVTSVPVDPLPPGRFGELVGPARAERIAEAADEARRLLDGRVFWNINSTAAGGGVAEMLQVLLAYARGAGVDARWLGVGGEPNFFTLTKRLHNRLLGAAGDDGELGDDERRCYEEVLAANAAELLDVVRSGDVVLLHDPQTAGLAARLRDAGAVVVWRCHVGTNDHNRWTDEAWAFLRP